MPFILAFQSNGISHYVRANDSGSIDFDESQDRATQFPDSDSALAYAATKTSLPVAALEVSGICDPGLKSADG